MSAWFVWSALGMYPVEPGSGEVVLGSPMFKRTVIRPEGALEATEIRARGLSDAAKFITGLRWHDAQGILLFETRLCACQRPHTGRSFGIADGLQTRRSVKLQKTAPRRLGIRRVS